MPEKNNEENAYEDPLNAREVTEETQGEKAQRFKEALEEFRRLEGMNPEELLAQVEEYLKRVEK
ncbi:MAG: hypothetical protein A2980_00220 [Candidatus Staskawiczbacteria bacterium RIFCSPLOWO2_01_FULL_33_13]|nr:MAG: hypothetical protein A2980_00220 [Candidatus Staskawiczbacteria bacterium RIFCSPLOWO2_01_FULL_33_13]